MFFNGCAFLVDNRGLTLIRPVQNDRANAAVVEGLDTGEIHARILEHLLKPSHMVPADKSRDYDLAAELLKYTCGVAAFTSRLLDRRRAALYDRDSKVRNIEDALDSQIRTDN